jgi:putative selenium metabolism protein SsnA
MILRNAQALTLSPVSIGRTDIRVQDGRVAARAKSLRPLEGEETVDLSGKLIMPGMVNAHTHLYSALARGMPAPNRSPRNFLQILKKVWWKLDEALDEESIYYSALVGCMDAIRSGTTTLIDHHSSPNYIIESLEAIADATLRVGVRAILCYETTDRGGRKRRDAGLDENERFIERYRNHRSLRGTAGAHASFTLNDDSMELLGELARMYDCGVHIHVAEDKADVMDATQQRHPERSPDASQSRQSRRMNMEGLVSRLAAFGILTDKSILAHGVHLTQPELRRIETAGAWLVHNPRSNMNNAVGYAPLRWFGRNSALGTDGFPSDMFEECKMGFFRNQESSHKVPFNRLPEMLQAGQRLVGSFFGKEFGTLAVGSAADLIVLDYVPPTPMEDGNLLGHFLFGMNAGMVESVMVNGEWQMVNGELVGIDEEKVMGEATNVARKLWRRMVNSEW